MTHKCFSFLHNNNIFWYEVFAETTNIKTSKKSGYALKMMKYVESKNGNKSRKRELVKINFCPFCGEKLVEEE